MQREVKAWLFDIQKAIIEIFLFVDLNSVTLEAYQADLKTSRAVERNLEIIGEAMSRILRMKNDLSITSSRQIVDLRNLIIHGYDEVSSAIILDIVLNHLPLLLSEVTHLLESE
jgi:uncharacterized protein with HEPN domain